MRRPRDLLLALLSCAIAASSAMVLAQCSGSSGAGDGPGDGGIEDAPLGEDADAAGERDAASARDGEGGPTCPAPEHLSTVSDAPAQRLVVQGDVGSVAIADPSIFYPPGAPGGALAFSSLAAAPGGAADQGAISTHVAVSSDHGATWTYVAAANTVTPTTAPAQACPDAGACTATIVNETSSIVFDASDVAARRWKLFTHRYVVVKQPGQKDLTLYTDGHIALATASVPAGPWSAPEVIAGWPGTPFSQDGAKYLPASDPATSKCGAFGEPGATVAPDGSLHLALACIQPPFASPTVDIVLLRSTDHAATWSYAGTPLRGADGACFGGDGKRVNAVDLFTLGTTEYLMATPEVGGSGRAGCVVFQIADVSRVTLRRDGSGAAVAARVLTPQFAPAELAHYAGACTYGEGATATGYTMSHLDVEPATPIAIHELATAVVAP